MRYSYCDLSDADVFRRAQAVEYFITSDIPNEEFLKQFFPPYSVPYSLKTYWEGCAQVLCGRGVIKLSKHFNKILFWFQDDNYPGFSTVEKFIMDNSEVCLPYVKEELKKQYQKRDIGWFKNLLKLRIRIDSTLDKKQISKANQLLEYLEDDEWKDCEQKFTSLIADLFS